MPSPFVPECLRWPQARPQQPADSDDAEARVVLYHRTTGRSAALFAETVARLESGAPMPRPVTARLERLHLLADGPRASLPELHPMPSARVLFLPSRPALWHPLPHLRTAGGFAYAARPLTAPEAALWTELMHPDQRLGRWPLWTVAERAGLSLPDAIATCAAWTDPLLQALQLRDRPCSPRDRSLRHLVAPPRPDHARTADQRDATGATTLTEYHLHHITDGTRHFDDRETTVAHALAVPHPALDGSTFGVRLHEALAAQGALPADPTAWIAEVGGGTGELARAFRSALTPAEQPYLRLDLSPELLRTQAARNPNTPGVLANATALPLRDASVALILNNEVIADLSAAPYDPAEPTAHPEITAWLQRLRDAGAPLVLDAPQPLNIGAWTFVAEVARVLAPGGWAYLSEFGEVDAPAQEAVQLDHPEVSIHFGHLLHIARALGLRATCVRLDTLLGADLDARHLARHSFEALQALARAESWPLHARAWTPATLAEVTPEPIHGLDWDPLSQEGPGPLMTRFHALLLHKALDSEPR